MASIILAGGGISGLAAGLMLARDGHAVRVLEADPDPVPESPAAAWAMWSRRGVSQFRQAHSLQARGRVVLDAALPDVAAAIRAAGGLETDLLGRMPPGITDRAPRPGDARFTALTARRPVLEWAFARAADAQPGLEVRRGSAVSGLLVESGAVPRVTGVRTSSGERLEADLVVDATGRRSRLADWLRAAGVPGVPEEAGPAGFVYYTRFLRSADGSTPAFMAPPVTPIGSISVATLPADRGTWSVTVFGTMRDRPLRRLRDAARWTAVVAACPRHAHWLAGRPMTGVMPMGGSLSRRRRLVAGGRPVASGILALGDACATTNPSLGRGMALAFVHAQRLVATVRAQGDDPVALAAAWDADTETHLTPWYRDSAEEDRHRVAGMVAAGAGRAPEPPADPAATLLEALATAAPHDADAYRAYLETRACLTPASALLVRPGLADRVRALARERGAPAAAPGPDRAQLLWLLSDQPARSRRRMIRTASGDSSISR